MNKRLSAIILALATSALLAIGCGSTASYDETEGAQWESDLEETEFVTEPGLEAELMESEAPPFGEPKETEPKKP
jgi:hypothetical protein